MIDFEQVNEYESLRKKDYVGFADVYLKRCEEEFESSEFNYEIDEKMYTKLVKLDTRLGTTAGEQLFWCLYYTTRLDIIQV